MKSKMYSIRLPGELKEKLEKLAGEKKMPLATYIKLLLWIYVEEK